MNTDVNALVLSGYGLNCEEETAAAFRLAGAQATIAHFNHLLQGEVRVADFDILALPGGFSFSDDLGSGKILAYHICHSRNDRNRTLLQDMEEFLGDGKLVVGICNGFQTLVQTPLLRGVGGKPISLTHNLSGRFEDRWVHLRTAPNTGSKAFRDVETLSLPVRHGEGRLVFENPEDFLELRERGQACLFYCDELGVETERYPYNPNGSPSGCAGLCDDSGQVLGMMPHPEAALSFYNHPDWPKRARQETLTHEQEGDGLQLFKNLIDACRERILL